MLKAPYTRTSTETWLGSTCALPPHMHPKGERCLPCLEPGELGDYQRPQMSQREEKV